MSVLQSFSIPSPSVTAAFSLSLIKDSLYEAILFCMYAYTRIGAPCALSPSHDRFEARSIILGGFIPRYQGASTMVLDTVAGIFTLPLNFVPPFSAVCIDEECKSICD